MQFTIATAGHVDHGKSTLLRALTGTDPDRLAEEKKRGLTVDLGFVWTKIGEHTVSFVDVPGHERFLGNMLAGLGPAPMVLFAVAADEGWMPQSDDHRDAVEALGIRRGLIVITRADRAPERVDEVAARARAELARVGIADAVAVSAVRGEGLEDVRAALGRLLDEAAAHSPHEAPLPSPGSLRQPSARLRLWVDRSFSIKGAGTVVTGTLAQSRLKPDQSLDVLSEDGVHRVSVRSLQSHDSAVESLEPVTRAALNLRGVEPAQAGRGSVLVEDAAQWRLTDIVDVRRTAGEGFTRLPEQVVVHIGTAAIPAHARAFDDEHVRLTLDRALPLLIGDRLVLRTSGTRAVAGGGIILDVDTPRLRRRGAGRRRAEELAGLSEHGSIEHEVRRRGAMSLAELEALGIPCRAIGEQKTAPAGASSEDGTVRIGEVIADRTALVEAVTALREAVARAAEDPLNPGVPVPQAVRLIGADRLFEADPAADSHRRTMLAAVVKAGRLTAVDGRIIDPARRRSLGKAEAGIAQLERRWRQEPFASPEARELQRLGLGPKELAAAEAQGRIVRIGGKDARGGAGRRGGSAAVGQSIVMSPLAPARARKTLAKLPQPFTAGQAKSALGVTRRVAIPLLEHLDSRGWTERSQSGERSTIAGQEG